VKDHLNVARLEKRLILNICPNLRVAYIESHLHEIALWGMRNDGTVGPSHFKVERYTRVIALTRKFFVLGSIRLCCLASTVYISRGSACVKKVPIEKAIEILPALTEYL
jgi:hypothetical protein